MEYLTDKKSYRNRKQEVYDLMLNRKTGELLELMSNLVQQAYIAGVNKLYISSSGNLKIDECSTGDLALLVQSFAKDKGLCQ
jgi:hypothetical protein